MFGIRCRALIAVRTVSSPVSLSRFTKSIPSTPLRPTISQPSLTQTAFAAPIQSQTRAFSASACLAGKRATYNPSRRVQKRRHGFLARIRSRGGRKIIMRRRAKGRKNLSW
ncbi:ribosomal protein L34-domain-containing protein [Aspergillus avenaceus]|uniref:Large ribosomal subunit protein bL34m n=1 Tax=Aspergillus avenaceus TaxID=36643 RepID=A0A5N6TE46_ASPAV|nr:ribosomal protein L34-domain-containing protein [Aspergillus avenaceus]